MNRKLIILFAFISISISSCNKFEHETFALPNCELCDYAESLEGTYRGISGGIAVPNFGDSVTVTIDQIFLGNSQYEDSTFIRFTACYDFDSSLDTLRHTITLEGFSGNCKANFSNLFGPGSSNPFNNPQGYYRFQSDSLFIQYSNYAGGGGPLTYFGASLVKQ